MTALRQSFPSDIYQPAGCSPARLHRHRLTLCVHVACVDERVHAVSSSFCFMRRSPAASANSEQTINFVNVESQRASLKEAAGRRSAARHVLRVQLQVEELPPQSHTTLPSTADVVHAHLDKSAWLDSPLSPSSVLMRDVASVQTFVFISVSRTEGCCRSTSLHSKCS